MKSELPTLLRYADLTDKLKVGKSTIQRWMSSTPKPFPRPVYIRGSAFFYEADVNQWLTENAEKSLTLPTNLQHKEYSHDC